VQVERLLRWLAPVVERVYAAPAARIDDLRRLEQVAAGAVSRSRFVGDLTLDPPRSTSDLAGPPLLDEDWLVLSTVHSAKGGEWDVVHLLHLADGCLPSDLATGDPDELEEERRLCYVGITRAERELTITYARRRNVFGAQTFGMRSRFVDEIPAELTDREEPVVAAGRARPGAWASAAQATAERAGERRHRPTGGGGSDLRLGDDVVHAAFGEGVVTGVEPGGIVVIRFAGDGSERKLMAEYAPISRR